MTFISRRIDRFLSN